MRAGWIGIVLVAAMAFGCGRGTDEDNGAMPDQDGGSGTGGAAVAAGDGGGEADGGTGGRGDAAAAGTGGGEAGEAAIGGNGDADTGLDGGPPDGGPLPDASPPPFDLDTICEQPQGTFGSCAYCNFLDLCQEAVSEWGTAAILICIEDWGDVPSDGPCPTYGVTGRCFVP